MQSPCCLFVVSQWCRTRQDGEQRKTEAFFLIACCFFSPVSFNWQLDIQLICNSKCVYKGNLMPNNLHNVRGKSQKCLYWTFLQKTQSSVCFCCLHLTTERSLDSKLGVWFPSPPRCMPPIHPIHPIHPIQLLVTPVRHVICNVSFSHINIISDVIQAAIPFPSQTCSLLWISSILYKCSFLGDNQQSGQSPSYHKLSVFNILQQLKQRTCLPSNCVFQQFLYRNPC